MLDINLDENKLDFNNIINTVDTRIGELKSSNHLDQDFKLYMWATLCPHKDEYQNFGVLQSIDILTVLYHIKSLGYEDIINNKPIIALGSSHGGYIANLLMKFAPNTFDAIIDNSCYAKPPLNYIVGFETNPNSAEYCMISQNIKINFFTLTNWSTKKNNNEFNNASYEIRDLSNLDQINQLSAYGFKTKVISYHSIIDTISSYEDKNNYIKELEKNNYKCILNTIKSEDQIDGTLIKNLNHSMGMSIKALVDTELPNILNSIPVNTETDLSLESIIKYNVSNNSAFVFEFNKNSINAKVI